MLRDCMGRQSGPSGRCVSCGIRSGHSRVPVSVWAGLESARWCTLPSVPLLGVSARLGSLKTVDQSVHTWPLQHGGLNVGRTSGVGAPETVSRRHHCLQTGSGLRCGVNSTIWYWTCNDRTHSGHHGGCQCRLWRERVLKKLWPSVNLSQIHFSF